jgi:sugar lactone lactonase YvrE
MSRTNTFTVVVNQVNGPPTIDPITNPVVNEGTLLSFTLTASDTNRPPQRLTFSLTAGAPAGASLSTNGVFSWTPTEAQGPGAYPIGVQVTDNGSPPLASVASFTVTVHEVNTPPALDPMGDITTLLGTPVIRAFAATDTDLPTQSLSFSLEPGAPPGATISPTGLFTWTPISDQAVGTNVIRVMVRDDGVPSLSITQGFTVVVRPNLSVEVGDILVADYGGNEVLKINPQSGAIQSLGTFEAPTDVALASDGNLYVTELFGTVRRLNFASQTVSLVNTNSTLYDLWGIAIAPSGDLLVLNTSDDRIVRIDPLTGGETLLSQSNLLSLPVGLDRLDATHLVVSSFNNDRLVSVALAGGAQTLLIETNGISFPWGVAASPAGIYVASWDQQRIQRVSGGVVSNLLPTVGAPQGLALETNGSVIAGVNGATSALVRLNPDGSWSNLVATGLSGSIAGIEVSTYRFGATPGSNTPPELYLQCSASVAGPFLDEPAAVFDKPAHTVTVSRSAGTKCFYRLRSNLPVRINSLRLNGSEAFLEYQFQ